jgi:hypothetical protein
MLQLPVGGRRGSPSRQISGLQISEGGDAEKEVTENIQGSKANNVLKPRHPRCVLRGGAPRQRRAIAAASDSPGGSGSSNHNGTEDPCALTPTRTVSNRSVSWGSKCKQFASRQCVESSNCSTAVDEAVSEEEEDTVAITKIVLNPMEQIGH